MIFRHPPHEAGPHRLRTLLLLLALSLLASQVQAHGAHGAADGFSSGFVHPLLGFDHVLAMVAVGLWGAFLGAQAMWLLPVVFPLVMALGGALGVMSVPLPWVETGIALSALVLGAMVLFAARPPLWVAALMVAVFAVFHGHAHGTELPFAADALSYSVGFVLSTGLLHALGIGLGLLLRWPQGAVAVRAGGAAIALGGVGFLTGLL